MSAAARTGHAQIIRKIQTQTDWEAGAAAVDNIILGSLHTCCWRREGMGDVRDSEVKWANVEDLGKMSIVDFYSDQWLSDAMCQVQAACEPVSLRAQIRGKYPVCAKVPHHISGIFSHCSLNLEGY